MEITDEMRLDAAKREADCREAFGHIMRIARTLSDCDETRAFGMGMVWLIMENKRVSPLEVLERLGEFGDALRIDMRANIEPEYWHAVREGLLRVYDALASQLEDELAEEGLLRVATEDEEEQELAWDLMHDEAHQASSYDGLDPEDIEPPEYPDE